jgi:hypothetical protein
MNSFDTAELLNDKKALGNAQLLLLRQQREMLAKKLAHKQKNGLLYYEPTDKQKAFHEAGASRRRYVRTGNRWGKSTAGTAEDISWARGFRVWYPEGDERRTLGIPKRAVKGVLLVQDWDKASEIFTNQQQGAGLGKFFKLLPEEWFAGVEKNNTGQICKVLIKSIYGGISMIFIDTVKSFLSNPAGHESSDWDFIHVDEPIPEAMWEAYSRGLIDRGGFAWFLCTPITEMWINDYFFPDGQIRSKFDDGLSIAGESKWLITGSTYDNTHLSEEDIQQFKADIPKEHWETRISGKPKALSGTIYTEFDPNLHCYSGVPFGWTSHTEPPSNYTIRVALDPHGMATPHAVTFCATSPFGTTYFYKEIYESVLSKVLAQMVMQQLSNRVPHVVLCDRHAFVEHPNDGRCMVDDFELEGLSVQPADKDLSRGILNVQAKLAERDRSGRPVLLFSPTLTEHMREFDRYVFDPRTGKPAAKAPDHMMENLYRLVNNGLEYYEPVFSTRRIKQGLPKLNQLDMRAAFRELKGRSGVTPFITNPHNYKHRYGPSN